MSIRVIDTITANSFSEVKAMGYAVAWLLGVPVTVLAIWFIVTHI
jgi:hypothetical protein